MNKAMPILIGLYRRLPSRFFRKGMRRLWTICRYVRSNRNVISKINGITYQMDLNELIDSSIYYKGYFERDTTLAINKLCKSGMTVVDIGANIGYYTLLLAKLVGPMGKVIAFEPAQWAFSKLKRNLELNDFDNITLEKKALSNENRQDQVRHFYCSWPLHTNSEDQIHPIHHGRAMKDIVDFATLDHYVKQKGIKKIDLIKLDVDGHEFKVIQGAVKTLRSFKPLIVMELSSYTLEEVGDNIADLVSLLSGLGFSFYSERGLSMFPSVDDMINSIPEKGGLNVVLSVDALL